MPGWPCPEYECGLEFNERHELEAHLVWDHNYSDYKAERKAGGVHGGAVGDDL